MQNHVIYTVEMLRRTPDVPESVIEIAWNHHERIDGSGYPHGLAGDAIPIEARIVAVADVYDVLTSDRPYRLARTVDEARAIVQSEAGSHLDARLVTSLLKSMDADMPVTAPTRMPAYRAG